jgi:hypothetical protein
MDIKVGEFVVPGVEVPELPPVPEGVTPPLPRVIFRVEGEVGDDGTVTPDVVQVWHEHDVHEHAKELLRDEVRDEMQANQELAE